MEFFGRLYKLIFTRRFVSSGFPAVFKIPLKIALRSIYKTIQTCTNMRRHKWFALEVLGMLSLALSGVIISLNMSWTDWFRLSTPSIRHLDYVILSVFE